MLPCSSTIIFIGYHMDAASMKITPSLRTELWNYKSRFTTLVREAWKEMSANFSTLEELVVTVNEILKNEKEPLVFETPPESHFAGFLKLQNQWSYTNTKFLERLILSACSSSLQEKMERYCEDYKSFRKALQITNKSHFQLEDYDLSKPCLILTIAKGPLTLDEIYEFLEKEFQIHSRYLRIHKIEPGSIKVTLQFPTSMTEIFQTCIEQKQEAVKHFVAMKLEPPKMTE